MTSGVDGSRAQNAPRPPRLISCCETAQSGAVARTAWSESVAIWQGRILATGRDAEIASLIGPATRVIDLDGKFATPGLNDAHLHLVSLGLTMNWVDASPKAAPTLEKLTEAISSACEAAPPGEWVLARGYDQTKLDVKRHPHRRELDLAAPDNPVMLVRACGHISICNSLRFGSRRYR